MDKNQSREVLGGRYRQVEFLCSVATVAKVGLDLLRCCHSANRGQQKDQYSFQHGSVTSSPHEHSRSTGQPTGVLGCLTSRSGSCFPALSGLPVIIRPRSQSGKPGELLPSANEAFACPRTLRSPFEVINDKPIQVSNRIEVFA